MSTPFRARPHAPGRGGSDTTTSSAAPTPTPTTEAGRAVLPTVAWAPLITMALGSIAVALLIGWQLVVNAEIYSRGQLPAPEDVYRAAEQMAEADQLWIQVEVSLERVLRGFALGSAVAIGVGLLVGLSPLAGQLIDPTVQAFRAIPSLAWVPLFVLWMGIGEEPKIMLIAIGVFFPVYANLVSGIRQIDRKMIEAASAYGYRRLSLAWNVTLPASLPYLMTGLRVGLAQGWLFLVAAELIGATKPGRTMYHGLRASPKVLEAWERTRAALGDEAYEAAIARGAARDYDELVDWLRAALDGLRAAGRDANRAAVQQPPP